MNKKILGICIPYYKNSEECEIQFKMLMKQLSKQITNDMILYVYEDGQVSEWLQEYAKENIIIDSCKINKGVSFARNVALEYLIKKVNYFLTIDSDDYVDDDYLTKMCDYCADNTHDFIESLFYINGRLIEYHPKEVRSCTCGTAIKTSLIGKKRYKKNIQIGEDTDFMHEVSDLTKQRKKLCRTIYYYQLGINPNSLTMLYQKNKIKKERGNENE